MDPAQGDVPAALPLAARFPAVPLARGWARRAQERPRARRLLPRLLLDADGAVVCRGRHESRLDRRDRAARADREDLAMGWLDGPPCRRRAGALGRRNAGDSRLRPLTANIGRSLDGSGRKPCRSPTSEASISITRSLASAARLSRCSPAAAVPAPAFGRSRKRSPRRDTASSCTTGAKPARRASPPKARRETTQG